MSTLTSHETQRQQSTVSSGDGFYHFAGLPPGAYDVEASANGMSTGVIKSVSVAAETTTGVDITLQTGSITETSPSPPTRSHRSRPRLPTSPRT